MMPSGHKAFLVHNTRDVDLLLMHNKTFAAEYVDTPFEEPEDIAGWETELTSNRISHAVSSRKRIEIVARAKELGVKVTNPKARVTTEV
jgi:ribosomal protein L32E